MKKKMYVIAAILVVLAILGTGTLAYFTTRVVTHNVITSGGVKIELVETMLVNGAEKPFVNPEGIMPGTEVSKIVRVTNKDAKAWVRIRVTEEINDRADSENVISINYNLGTAPTQWTQKGDWFYYNMPLENGQTTEPLFKGVTLAGEEMDNDYQNATIEISVQAEAIQFANNENFDTAWPDGVAIEEAIY